MSAYPRQVKKNRRLPFLLISNFFFKDPKTTNKLTVQLPFCFRQEGYLQSEGFLSFCELTLCNFLYLHLAGTGLIDYQSLHSLYIPLSRGTPRLAEASAVPVQGDI